MAVEWVRDNIAAFGGSPRKITLAGQSSGGVAVDYWAYAFMDDPIAHSLIAHSGNAFSFPVHRPGVPAQNWNTVVTAVGCANDTDVMACMRRAPWTALKAAAAAVKPAASSSVLRSIPPFYPTPDNTTVFSDYEALTRAGRFARLPLLLGSNANEAGYYRVAAFGNGLVPTDAQTAAFHLESFTCPVAAQAAGRRAAGVPAWAYRYAADWASTRLYAGSGVYHGADLHMVFGGADDVSGRPGEAAQAALTREVQRAWRAFGADPEGGLVREMGWPVFDPGAETLVLLGEENRPAARLVMPSVYDAACSTVTLGALG